MRKKLGSGKVLVTIVIGGTADQGTIKDRSFAFIVELSGDQVTITPSGNIAAQEVGPYGTSRTWMSYVARYTAQKISD